MLLLFLSSLFLDKMSKVILNYSVIFDEEQCSLHLAGNRHHAIILGATTSRCLALFIENQGKVLYKKDLLHNGWGKSGTVVSEGSLWQMISQLRKAFEHFNLDARLIITVPRIGYKLSSALVIEPEYQDTLPVHIPDETVGLYLPSSSQITFPIRWLTILLLLNVLLFTLIYAYQSSSLQLSASQPGWHFSHQFGDTAIYVQDHSSSEKHINERAITLMPDGMPAEYIYINHTADKTLKSYFLCRREISERDNGCITSIMVSETSG